MDPRLLRTLLERVRSQESSVDEAYHALETLPFEDLGFANVDHHRALRQGAPEVILGERKTPEQIAGIAAAIARGGQNVLVTRLDPEKAQRLLELAPTMRHAPVARTAMLEVAPVALRAAAPVAVVTGGTSDLPVAEEAVETLASVGLEAVRLFDVGVAGLHRLLSRLDELRKASAVIVVAGMEGALPSVVGGMLATPIVAVPTSVGYGTALGGFTPLLAMLTSCASGIVVVNIDSGFGAAMAVHRMLPKERRT